jgi:hypothetical protein
MGILPQKNKLVESSNTMFEKILIANRGENCSSHSTRVP